MQIATGWKYYQEYKPERKASYFAIEKDGMEIDARVVGWLDLNLDPTTKSKAAYIHARRFSYNTKGRDNINQFFAMPY